jgi:HemK-related putative methylase
MNNAINKDQRKKKEIILKVLNNVYEPAEDSELLLEAIKNEKGSLLEIGCGSGYICLNYAKKGYKVYACDISKEALINTKINAALNGLKNIKVFYSDVFSAFNKLKNKKKFDVIVFNPPYLEPASEKRTDMLEDNGSIIKFIRNVKYYLKNNGRAYILISTENRKFNYYKNLLIKDGWKCVKKQSFFFETLYVFKLKNNVKNKKENF